MGSDAVKLTDLEDVEALAMDRAPWLRVILAIESDPGSLWTVSPPSYLRTKSFGVPAIEFQPYVEARIVEYDAKLRALGVEP